MKAVSQIMSVILVLSIAIAMVAFLWVFISGTYIFLTRSGESTVGRTLVTISSCMRIESVSGNKVYVKNCGEGSITKNTLSVYLNDIPLNFTMSPTIVNKDDVGTVNLQGLWGVPQGRYLLKVTNPKVITEREVETVLPDSCVLALDFDEGEGVIAHDSSRYNNDGYLRNGTQQTSYSNCTTPDGRCPKWVDGKFGKALEFGLNQQNYVFVSFSESLQLTGNKITVSNWVKLRTRIPDSVYRPVMIDKGGNDFRLDFNPKPQFNIVNATGSGFQVNDYSTTIEIDKWYHFIAAINGTNITLFTNGKEIDVKPFVGTINNNYKILIAQYIFGQSNYNLNGTVDSVRIYNDYLTPSEITGLRSVSYD